MSVESAKAYIERMRGDESFRRMMNACDGEDAGWQLLKEHGYEFSLNEFKEAQARIYAEHGITPL